MNKIIASNGYINILDIQYGINDKIKTSSNNRYKKIRYNPNEFFKVQ